MRRRTAPTLQDRLTALDDAVAVADGRLDPASVGMAVAVADKARSRAGHGSNHTLAAMLGATGGGKSSLVNAVAGNEVATTGVRRPTTSSTLALVWGHDDATALLDWLEVMNRHQVPGPSPGLDGLVLLDVPDHDSVADANRLEMERIAEQADLLVWVTDPQKYGDQAMHAYLRRLHRHGPVMLMVLNKIDQLTEADVDRCVADLRRLLTDDGLENVTIVATSTATGYGVDALVGLLARAVDQRRAMVERLTADIATAASELLSEIGPDDRVDRIPNRVRSDLAGALVAASDVPVVADAVAAGHRRDAAARTGWPFTRWSRSLRPHPLRRFRLGAGSTGRSSRPEPSGVQRARVDGAIRDAVATVTTDLPDPWPQLVRQAATPDPAALADQLDQAVAGAVRSRQERTPRWWSVVNVVPLVLAAAVIVGLVWLTATAVVAYFQLPDLPTSVDGYPVPTLLVFGGVVLGLLLAFLSGRLAAVGARRAARAVRGDAEAAVGEVTDRLVLQPMQHEIDRRNELRSRLVDAGGRLVPVGSPR
ncbi:MAG: GTPase family protein [Acidimicrobiales bacterium]